MIAPEGYVPLSELYEKARREYWSDVLDYFNYEIEVGGEVISYFRPGDVLLSWLLECLAGKFFLANAEGLIFKIDDRFATVRVSEVPRLSVGIENMEQYSSESFMQIKYRLAPLLKPDVDITQFVRDKFLLSDYFLHPMLFFDPTSFVVDFELFDFIKENANDVHRSRFNPFVSEKLRPLTGFSLCVPESHVNERWSKYWLEIAIRAKEISSSFSRDDYYLEVSTPLTTSNSPSRRKTKLGKVEKVLSELGPNPKGNYTWKELVRHCSKEMNETVSIDTVKRALGKK